MSGQLKVLISAYACEPGSGSEPGVGWNQVLQTARFHRVWVLTRANNRTPIEEGLRAHPDCSVHWVYYDLPPWLRFWKRGQRGVHLYYYLWQMGAFFAGRSLDRRIRFDIVHHVTFANYWLPSFLALLRPPFLWGPVGGGESTPRPFLRLYGLRGRAYETLREAARRIGEREPGVRLTARRAALALATTAETARRLRRIGCRRVRVMSEAGLSRADLGALGSLQPTPEGSPYRLVSVGRLLHLKGFQLGLMAFARLRETHPASEYWLIGEGPERPALERLALRLGLGERVRFLGRLGRDEVFRRLAECDVLVHPSLHESGGWVCLEAMAAGRPVICLDHGGPGTQVTSEAGVKVLPVDPERAVRDIASAMAAFAADRELRRSAGAAGRSHVGASFSWDAKGEQIRALYEEVAGGRPCC